LAGMNPPRATAEGHIDFLVATPKAATASEAARVQPHGPRAAAHDAFSRLPERLEPDPAALWEGAWTQVRLGEGVLVFDDTVLDKPYARKIELVGRHRSGKHHAAVQGIDLVSLVWRDGDRTVPCDYRICHDAKQATKNDHFRAMADAAGQRGFAPECVLFGGWYSSLEDLKHLRDKGWRWLTRLKPNRLVNEDGQGLRPLSRTETAAGGTEVWLKGYGPVKVFKVAAPDGGIAHWATGDLSMTGLRRRQLAEYSWTIGTYHRGIKQHAEAEKCQSRSATAQRNHIGMALRAFLRLDCHFFRTGVSWAQAKDSIIWDAVRAYLANPFIRLSTA